ncbi:MAG: HTH domain-containing protein [Haloarculaceae archaeon]
MERDAHLDPIRLELYVRTLSPPGARSRQEAVIDRLDALAESERVDDWYVKVWGKQIDPTTNAADTDQGQFILNRIAEFQQWALANNATLESFYQTREQSSSITGEDHTSIVLPKMGLAEYHGSELAQVTPCTRREDDDVCTVIDHLNELERRLTAPAGTQSPSTPVAEE